MLEELKSAKDCAKDGGGSPGLHSGTTEAKAKAKAKAKGKAKAKAKAQVTSGKTKIAKADAKQYMFKCGKPFSEAIRRKRYPAGCNRCRHVAGCTPSCWKKRRAERARLS